VRTSILIEYSIHGGRVAWSVQRLATGWTVWGSNPGGGDIFRTCPDRPWVPPSLLYSGYLAFPGGKSGRDVTLTPHPLLVPWSRKGRAIPLIPLWAVRPVQSLSVCTSVHFTLPLQYTSFTVQFDLYLLVVFHSSAIYSRHDINCSCNLSDYSL